MIYFLTVNYYSSNLIEKLISSIQSTGEKDWKILVINNSADESCLENLKEDSTVLINTGENLGFGRACNIGLQWVYERDRRSLVWIINPDACLEEDAIEQALLFFHRHPEISLLGTAIREPNGQVWFGGGKFIPQDGTILPVEDLQSEGPLPYQLVDWITGCSLLIDLKHFAECPHFDPDFFLYYEDFDFCRRYASQGHLTGTTSQIRVIHHPSSITSRYPDLKQQHATYSYLLALEKHASSVVLWSRLAKMTLSALAALPFQPKMASNKLRGVVLYCKRVIRVWGIHF